MKRILELFKTKTVIQDLLNFMIEDKTEEHKEILEFLNSCINKSKKSD